MRASSLRARAWLCSSCALTAAAALAAEECSTFSDQDGQCSNGPSKPQLGEYYWPQGKGPPRHFGQSPYAFGSQPCNLSGKLSWTWKPTRHVILVGKPLVDDQMNVYVSSEDGVHKLSRKGDLLWTWPVPEYHPDDRAIPNNPAINDGLLYQVLTSGELFALDMDTGALVWMVPVSQRIGGDTAFVMIEDGRVIIDVDAPDPPLKKNRIVALNSTDGKLLWEFAPDTGVWNFIPHFAMDGTMLFQAWTGAAFRLRLSDGHLLWRAGPSENTLTWSDGGPSLGPNGIFYTVSSNVPQKLAIWSSGGALRAFNVSNGDLLWEREHFDQGIYTWPAVGRLGDGPELSVVTGVGSLAALPLRLILFVVVPYVAFMGCLGGFLWGCCCRAHSARTWRGTCRCASCGAAVAVFIIVGIILLVYTPKHPSSVQAFRADTGEIQWSVELPTYWGYAAKGDAEGMRQRRLQGTRLICLPCTSAYGVLDAQGIFYMGHLDGRLYAIKDWNHDGRIEASSEICSFQTEAAFLTGGPTIVPGMLLITTCDTVYAFEE